MGPRHSASRRTAVLSHGNTTRRHRPDYTLVLISLLLLALGLVIVYSISPGLAVQKHQSQNYFVIKQLLAIGIGSVAFIVTSAIPLTSWRYLQKPLIAAAGLATMIALIMPASVEYPAHRWIRFGGISLQSVELIKFALVICLAWFLALRARNGTINDVDKTLKPLIVILLVLGVIVAVAQKDLGSTGVLVAMVAAMAYVAGLPMKRIFQITGLIAIGTLLAISTSAYRRDRVLTFLNPESDCQGSGYQACHALVAIGSGGIAGKGLGRGVEAFGYLPEAANDSIFAILAEKFGFLGVTLLICVYAIFFTRLVRIMERSPDAFSRLLVAGVLAWLSTQAIINIGAMLGLLPLKGITLPFVSYGGTSIIFVLGVLGLVFNISRYTTYSVSADLKEGRGYEDSTVRRRDRRTYYANSGRRI